MELAWKLCWIMGQMCMVGIRSIFVLFCFSGPFWIKKRMLLEL